MAKKGIVVGSFVVDLMGRCPHLPAPGETVKGDTFKTGPGGKGSNQAVAAKRAGADVNAVTKIGKDQFGQIARDCFEEEDFPLEYLIEDENHDTGIALILVDKNTSQNEILVYSGACDYFTDEDFKKIRPLLDASDILLMQLEINLDFTERCLKYAKSKGICTILNPAPVVQISDELYDYIDIITPNEVEASILSGITVTDEESAHKSAEWFRKKGVETVIITMGSKGAYLETKEHRQLFPIFSVNAIDTTGAGDAFNGGLLAALTEEKDLLEAICFAQATAALSVTKIGTAPSMPYREEIDTFLADKNR